MSENRVVIGIGTANEIHGLTGAANLDAAVELWRLPSSGTGSFARWERVPDHLLSFRHTPRELNVEATFVLGSSGLSSGEYAVAVKSEGGYSDIGQYRIQVIGKGVHETNQPLLFQGADGPLANYLGWLDTIISEMQILPVDAAPRKVLAILGNYGALDESEIKSEPVKALVAGALAQDDPGAVLLHLFQAGHWKAVSEKDKKMFEQRLSSAFRRTSKK